MADAGLEPELDTEETTTSEALAELRSMATRRAGEVLADVLARHVQRSYEGEDWAIRRGAMEAILRRLDFADRDGLTIRKKPGPRRPTGEYVTGRSAKGSRPYRTRIDRVDPLDGSCGCPDFVRGGLGVCKHLLTVLQELSARPVLWKSACTTRPATEPRLRWDPIPPLTEPHDWMLRLRLEPGGTKKSPLERWFAGEAGSTRMPSVAAIGGRRRRFLAAIADAKHVDPSIPPLVADEAARLERSTRLDAARRRLASTLGTLKRPLYPYQAEGVARFLESGRLLLADDMGLGKTMQAIGAGHVLWRNKLAQRGLFVVPASLKSQWLREWTATSNAPVAVIDGSPDDRRAQYRRTKSGFLIVNYEQVVRDLDALRAWRPDVVVLDEAQRIKNWATRTAACVKELRSEYRLVLTGTPMENRLDELASIMDWVDDYALEPKWRLAPAHAMLADGRRQVVGARHLGVLRDRLARCLLRRRRSEILDQLPERTDTTLTVELTPEQQDEHDALLQPIAALTSVADRRPLTQPEFLRLMSLLTTQRVIANGLAQLRYQEMWPKLERAGLPNAAILKGLDSPKLLELREVVERIAVEQGRKIVVFSQWRRMLKLARFAISDLLEAAGLRAAFFTGHESRRRRTQNVIDFHDEDDLRVLFLTDAGGVGLNLQRAASCCVNLELPWNPAVLEQRIGRIHRLGQTQAIDVYNMISAGSIEERIASLVEGKRKLFESVFDGDSNEVRFERSGTFLEDVKRIVSPLEAVGRSHADDLETVIEETVEQADEQSDVPDEDAQVVETAGPPPQVAELFQSLRIERTEGGGMRIEADPHAAETLAALFEGLARTLRRQ